MYGFVSVKAVPFPFMFGHPLMMRGSPFGGMDDDDGDVSLALLHIGRPIGIMGGHRIIEIHDGLGFGVVRQIHVREGEGQRSRAELGLVDHPSLSDSVDRETSERIGSYFLKTISDSHSRFSNARVVGIQEMTATRSSRVYRGGTVSRIMLWHGTPSENIPSILSNGLRVGKPGMFGVGIYFADCSSKSLQYCSSGRKCHLLLCEVDTGAVCKMTSSESSLVRAPNGSDSVMGVGKFAPSSTEHYEGAVWPAGTLCQKIRSSPELNFNEYVIYGSDRVRVRFVLTVQVD